MDQPMRRLERILAMTFLRSFVTCADCGVPLGSSRPKGGNQHYAYYLCQTKTCESFGKSIRRKPLETMGFRQHNPEANGAQIGIFRAHRLHPNWWT